MKRLIALCLITALLLPSLPQGGFSAPAGSHEFNASLTTQALTLALQNFWRNLSRGDSSRLTWKVAGALLYPHRTGSLRARAQSPLRISFKKWITDRGHWIARVQMESTQFGYDINGWSVSRLHDLTLTLRDLRRSGTTLRVNDVTDLARDIYKFEKAVEHTSENRILNLENALKRITYEMRKRQYPARMPVWVLSKTVREFLIRGYQGNSTDPAWLHWKSAFEKTFNIQDDFSVRQLNQHRPRIVLAYESEKILLHEFIFGAAPLLIASFLGWVMPASVDSPTLRITLLLVFGTLFGFLHDRLFEWQGAYPVGTRPTGLRDKIAFSMGGLAFRGAYLFPELAHPVVAYGLSVMLHCFYNFIIAPLLKWPMASFHQPHFFFDADQDPFYRIIRSLREKYSEIQGTETDLQQLEAWLNYHKEEAFQLTQTPLTEDLDFDRWDVPEVLSWGEIRKRIGDIQEHFDALNQQWPLKLAQIGEMEPSGLAESLMNVYFRLPEGARVQAISMLNQHQRTAIAQWEQRPESPKPTSREKQALEWSYLFTLGLLREFMWRDADPPESLYALSYAWRPVAKKHLHLDNGEDASIRLIEEALRNQRYQQLAQWLKHPGVAKLTQEKFRPFRNHLAFMDFLIVYYGMDPAFIQNYIRSLSTGDQAILAGDLAFLFDHYLRMKRLNGKPAVAMADRLISWLYRELGFFPWVPEGYPHGIQLRLYRGQSLRIPHQYLMMLRVNQHEWALSATDGQALTARNKNGQKKMVAVAQLLVLGYQSNQDYATVELDDEGRIVASLSDRSKTSVEIVLHPQSLAGQPEEDPDLIQENRKFLRDLINNAYISPGQTRHITSDASGKLSVGITGILPGELNIEVTRRGDRLDFAPFIQITNADGPVQNAPVNADWYHPNARAALESFSNGRAPRDDLPPHFDGDWPSGILGALIVLLEPSLWGLLTAGFLMAALALIRWNEKSNGERFSGWAFLGPALTGLPLGMAANMESKQRLQKAAGAIFSARSHFFENNIPEAWIALQTSIDELSSMDQGSLSSKEFSDLLKIKSEQKALQSWMELIETKWDPLLKNLWKDTDPYNWADSLGDQLRKFPSDLFTLAHRRLIHHLENGIYFDPLSSPNPADVPHRERILTSLLLATLVIKMSDDFRIQLFTTWTENHCPRLFRWAGLADASTIYQTVFQTLIEKNDANLAIEWLKRTASGTAVLRGLLNETPDPKMIKGVASLIQQGHGTSVANIIGRHLPESRSEILVNLYRFSLQERDSPTASLLGMFLDNLARTQNLVPPVPEPTSVQPAPPGVYHLPDNQKDPLGIRLKPSNLILTLWNREGSWFIGNPLAPHNDPIWPGDRIELAPGFSLTAQFFEGVTLEIQNGAAVYFFGSSLPQSDSSALAAAPGLPEARRMLALARAGHVAYALALRDHIIPNQETYRFIIAPILAAAADPTWRNLFNKNPALAIRNLWRQMVRQFLEHHPHVIERETWKSRPATAGDLAWLKLAFVGWAGSAVRQLMRDGWRGAWREVGTSPAWKKLIQELILRHALFQRGPILAAGFNSTTGGFYNRWSPPRDIPENAQELLLRLPNSETAKELLRGAAEAGRRPLIRLLQQAIFISLLYDDGRSAFRRSHAMKIFVLSLFKRITPRHITEPDLIEELYREAMRLITVHLLLGWGTSTRRALTQTLSDSVFHRKAIQNENERRNTAEQFLKDFAVFANKHHLLHILHDEILTLSQAVAEHPDNYGTDSLERLASILRFIENLFSSHAEIALRTSA